MNTNTSNRSHHDPKQGKDTNRLRKNFMQYLCFITNESKAFLMLWVSIVLMFGAICSHSNEIGQDEFYRFIFFLQNPIVIVINALAFIAALFHSVTWFYSFSNRVLNKSAKTKLYSYLSMILLLTLTIVVSVILLLIIFG